MIETRAARIEGTNGANDAETRAKKNSAAAATLFGQLNDDERELVTMFALTLGSKNASLPAPLLAAPQ